MNDVEVLVANAVARLLKRRETARAKAKRYYEKNKAVCHARQCAWRAENREWVNALRRARRKGCVSL